MNLLRRDRKTTAPNPFTKPRLAFIGLAGLFLFSGCSHNYSDGYRVGYVRKFSRKGLIWKSWEGELLLGGVVSTGGKSPEIVN
jgi:hypothetical protein